MEQLRREEGRESRRLFPLSDQQQRHPVVPLPSALCYGARSLPFGHTRLLACGTPVGPHGSGARRKLQSLHCSLPPPHFFFVVFCLQERGRECNSSPFIPNFVCAYVPPLPFLPRHIPQSRHFVCPFFVRVVRLVLHTRRGPFA
ncbi:unnamed protein product [Ixodes persulcatus]